MIEVIVPVAMFLLGYLLTAHTFPGSIRLRRDELGRWSCHYERD